MEHLDDELDLRYHRGLKPDVYYRCPTLEALEGALRNELERSASSLIPIETVTEFVFSTISTITIPVVQQPALDALIQPADHLQSITVALALCRDIDGKDRLCAQRAISKSIIQAVQDTDGFRYCERSAQNKEGGDGARLRYVCLDSLQNRDRLRNMKKDSQPDNGDSEGVAKKKGNGRLPTYDCKGAVHIKFSLKREAINVVYKHNPIHGSRVNEQSLPPLGVDSTTSAATRKPTKGFKDAKRKRSKREQADVDNNYRDPNLEISTGKPRMKKNKKGKEPLSPTTPRTKSGIVEPSPTRKLSKGRACVRCREKKIKCNEGKPACNQCLRGLWTCQYESPSATKRSKSGCIDCKNRKRKCTEERPACTRCLRENNDCTYGELS